MKKLKLLIGIAALLLGGANSVNAQKDVTDTYITNPGFETSPIFDGTSLGSNADPKANATPTTGAELISGAINVYNISGWTNITDVTADYARVFTMPYNTTIYVNGNNAAAGQQVNAPTNGSSVTSDNNSVLFVEANWCGNATLGIKQDIILPAGVYKLSFDSYVSTSLANAVSLCGVKIGNAGTYKWPLVLDTWTSNEVYFIADADNTNATISMGYVKSHNVGGGSSAFLYVDNIKLELINATVPVSAPIDVTSKISNPKAATADGSNAKDWTGSNHRNGGNGFDDAAGFFEPSSWSSKDWEASFNQSLTGLPNGLYTLKAAVQSETDVISAIKAGNSFSTVFPANGTSNGTIAKDGSEVAAGSGVAGWNYGTTTAWVTDGTLTIGGYSGASAEHKWTNFDNFTLSYIPLEEITMDAAKANYNAMKEKVIALKDNTGNLYTDNNSAVSALDEAISTADGLFASATGSATINAQTENIRKAGFAFLGNITLNAGKTIDITAFIKNASFENNNADGWTASPVPGFQSYNNAEYYEKDFNISQTLTDLPAGKSFKLKVQAFQRPGLTVDVYNAYAGSTDKTKNVTSEIYVNTKSQKIKNLVSETFPAPLGTDTEDSWQVKAADGVFVPGSMYAAEIAFNTVYEGTTKYYENEVAAAADEDGKLTFGFRNSSHVGADWTIFDNFRLYYAGDDLSGFAADLTAVISSVKTNIDALAISNNAKTILKAQADTYEQTYSSAAEYTEAITAVNAIETTARSMVKPYADYNALNTKANNLKDVANDNATANSTLATAISDQTTAAEAATTASAIETATSTLKTAMATYVFAATPVGDGAKFDCTFLMTNPDLTGLATWAKADGWTSEEEDGNSQVMVNASKTVGDKSYFYEYWSDPAKASGKFALYNAVTLPKGTFSMSCYAFAEDQYTASTVDGVYFYANDTQGSCVTATVLTEQTLSFVNSAEQEVKIGLKTVTGNTRNWMGIGYVELYKVPAAAAVVLDESVAYVEAATAADVELTKTIYEGWNTVVLPFSMTAEEVATVLGAGKLYAFTGADAGSLNFSEASALSAHTPYLFKADAAKNISGETISGRTITESSNSLKTAGTDYNFVGTYTPYAQGESPIVVGADYVLGADANFHLTTVKNALKAFRAYIQANKADDPAPARLAIVIDGETTAIEAIDGRVLNNAAIYNLAGQKVQNAQKGIFIQNGKKVVK